MSVVSSPDLLNPQSKASAPFSRRDVWIYPLVFAAFFFSAVIDLRLVHLQNGNGIIWVPAGIALAAILLKGNRIVPVIFLASFLVELNSGQTVLSAMAIAGGNAGEGLLGG